MSRWSLAILLVLCKMGVVPGSVQPVFYAGDIMLTADDLMDENLLYKLNLNNTEKNVIRRLVKRGATAIRERIWEGGVIPYEIDSRFGGSMRLLFRQAMDHWESHTCLTFVERGREHEDYIKFTETNCGCCSFVGRKGGGGQSISIGPNCDDFGTVVHELGHAVGFWHEHMRPDRDKYIEVLFENILQFGQFNYHKLPDGAIDTLKEPYDFDSIMHYKKDYFSSNQRDTIALLGDQHEHAARALGQRVQLSKGDIRQTNLLYKCPECGKTLQDPRGEIHVWHRSKHLCQWRISVQPGEQITIIFNKIDIPRSSKCEAKCEGKCEDYLEVRDGHFNKSKLLGRYCGEQKLPIVVKSSGSRLWIGYQSSGKGYGFSASYNAACGGNISIKGQISSPNYPAKYSPNKRCTWKLDVPAGYRIQLNFTAFELEPDADCKSDYVEIHDGPDSSSKLLAKLCGFELPSLIKSNSNEMYVKFVSDSSVQTSGFLATFKKFGGKNVRNIRKTN